MAATCCDAWHIPLSLLLVYCKYLYFSGLFYSKHHAGNTASCQQNSSNPRGSPKMDTMKRKLVFLHCNPTHKLDRVDIAIIMFENMISLGRHGRSNQLDFVHKLCSCLQRRNL